MEDEPIDLGGLMLGGGGENLSPLTLFLRKIGRQSDWGDPDDAFNERVAGAAAAVFRPEDSAFSLYQVATHDDLKRVVAGMAANRSNPIQNIDMIAFTGDELARAGIRIHFDAPGELGCVAANSLHVDVESEHRESFTDLCRQAMNRQRRVRRFNKNTDVRKMVTDQRNYGCEAFFENVDCPCRTDVEIGTK